MKNCKSLKRLAYNRWKGLEADETISVGSDINCITSIRDKELRQLLVLAIEVETENNDSHLNYYYGN